MPRFIPTRSGAGIPAIQDTAEAYRGDFFY